MICKKGFHIKPYKSAAGWYLGTHDEEGFPYCRISVEYFKTEELAEQALETGIWTKRNSFETQFCCGE